MRINLVPIGNVEERILRNLIELLKKRKIYINLLKPTDISDSYNPYRKQYDADKILAKLKPNTLAITNEDLFCHGLNFIFGLAWHDKCIVTYHRLRNEFYGEKRNFNILMKRIFKEVLHELGHVLGLKHCNNVIRGKPCVMTFSNHIGEVDMKGDMFCKKCKNLLKLRENE